MTTNSSTLATFSTWAELLAFIAAGGRVLYGMMPTNPQLPMHTAHVVRVFKNGKLRIDLGYAVADAFTADASHLARFARRVSCCTCASADDCCDFCWKRADDEEAELDARKLVYQVRDDHEQLVLATFFDDRDAVNHARALNASASCKTRFVVDRCHFIAGRIA